MSWRPPGNPVWTPLLVIAIVALSGLKLHISYEPSAPKSYGLGTLLHISKRSTWIPLPLFRIVT